MYVLLVLVLVLCQMKGEYVSIRRPIALIAMGRTDGINVGLLNMRLVHRFPGIKLDRVSR